MLHEGQEVAVCMQQRHGLLDAPGRDQAVGRLPYGLTEAPQCHIVLDRPERRQTGNPLLGLNPSWVHDAATGTSPQRRITSLIPAASGGSRPSSAAISRK